MTDGDVTSFRVLSDILCTSPMLVVGLRTYITQSDTFSGGSASLSGENALKTTYSISTVTWSISRDCGVINLDFLFVGE